MSKELDKQTLVRSAWLTELRRQGDRQCDGELSIGGRVCALGLLAEVAGLSIEDAYFHIPMSGLLTFEQLEEVWRMNDGAEPTFGPPVRKHTFSEIADVVEGWFHA